VGERGGYNPVVRAHILRLQEELDMAGRRFTTLVAVVLVGAFGGTALAGLTNHWPLDDGSGTIATNTVVGGTPGTIYYGTTGGLGAGGQTWITTDPTRGTVLSFNGDNSIGTYVDGGTISLPEITGDFTWTFWANLQASGTGGSDVIIGNRYNGPGWAKFTPTNFEWHPTGGGTGGNLNIADIPIDGNWDHHAIVKTGTVFQYYLNGVPGASGNFTAPFTGAVPFYIGGDANNERIAGLLDDVATFDQALTQTQVQAIMNGDYSEFTGPPPPPTIDVTLLLDDFPSGGVNLTKWSIINKGLESTADGNYDPPSTAGDVLTLGGTTTHSYWAGSTLQSVDTFPVDDPTTFLVDRVSLARTGTAGRSSMWIWADDGHYLHFSQNDGEGGWTYNWNDLGGLGGTPTGSGINIPGLDSLDNDLGLHEMGLVFIPGENPGEATIQMLLDGEVFALRSFSSWPGDFHVLLTGQARQSGDTVSAVFDNVHVFATQDVLVPEPATLALLGLGGLVLRRRRR